jgi:3-phosphoshikimate 1-carboxyvinyltransferase
LTPTVKDIANLPVDRLPPLVHVPPLTGPFDVTVRPPGSKSLTNRALLLAALADGESVLTGALAEADDAQVMVRALRQLGAEIELTPEVEPNGESCGNATIRVKGVGGRWKIKPGETVTLNLNNAGTATRFLTAAAVLQPEGSGGIVIDGNARMRERPIGELVEALRAMGVTVEYVGREGYPPVRVLPAKLEGLEPRLRLGRTSSSQFLSALLLVGAFLPRGVHLFMPDGVTSESYVSMTWMLIEGLGIKGNSMSAAGESARRVQALGDRLWPATPPDGPMAYAPRPFATLPAFRLPIEADASGAGYFWAAASLVEGAAVGPLDVYSTEFQHGLARRECLQSDVFVARALGETSSWIPRGAFRAKADRMGIRDWLGNMPDAAMTFVSVAAFREGMSEFTGLRTLRVKETDRIAAIVNELGKIGVQVEPFAYTDEKGHSDEGVRVRPPEGGVDCSALAPRVEFDTYDDHRMAMSLALIGLRRPNVYVRDPGCVRKTYPTFWRDLAKLYK